MRRLTISSGTGTLNWLQTLANEIFRDVGERSLSKKLILRENWLPKGVIRWAEFPRY